MALNRADRAWLNAQIDTVIQEVGSIEKRRVADAFLAKMRAATEGGDYQYMPLIWQMAENGITRAVGDRIRADADGMLVAATGHIVSLPTRQAVKERDEAGVPTGVSQMKLWRVISRAEFDAMVQDRIKRHDTEQETIDTFVRMQQVWDKYPEAMTVIQAIHLAGMSLNDFGITIEAMG